MSAQFFAPSARKRLTRTISITSGKGGVGKTTLVCNLAVHLANKGNKVLILDGDFGMANVDIMFGQRAPSLIEGVLSGHKTLREAIVPLHTNVSLIPGGSGIYGLHNVGGAQKQLLVDQVGALENQFDYMLIDTAPGIGDNVLYLNAAAQEIVVVLTPDPASLIDSYALIKLLNRKYKETQFSVVCNMVRNETEAMGIYRKVSDLAERFLCVNLHYQGFVPIDQELRRATKSQQLLALGESRSPANFAVQDLAEKLSGFGDLSNPKGGMQFFWEQMVGVA